MVWKTVDKTTPRKFKGTMSAGKVLATIFLDRKSVLLFEYCPKGSTVTYASYFDTLIHLQKAIQSKHPGLLKQKVIFLRENVTPPSAKLTQSLLSPLKWNRHERSLSFS